MEILTQEKLRIWTNLYWSGKHQDFLDCLLYLVRSFKSKRFYKNSNYYVQQVNNFLPHFFYFLLRPDLKLDQRDRIRHFLRMNCIIADIVHLSVFQTTDVFIQQLLLQPNSTSRLAKVLLLYSPRNTIRLDYQKIFSTHPVIANLWYGQYLYHGDYRNANQLTRENIRYHLEFDSGTLYRPDSELHASYFMPTYIDAKLDRLVRSRVNRAFARHHPQTEIFQTKHVDGRTKVAVLSKHWFRNNAVYRTQAGYIRSLMEEYHLTLVQLSIDKDNDYDTSMFAEIIEVNKADSEPSMVSEESIKTLRDAGFTALYYPAIGTDSLSVHLANLVIAPIQISGMGHPVSSFGSRINLMFSGTAVEDKNLIAENFSEHVILLPGFGLMYEPIDYPHAPKQPTNEPLIVNCSWHAQKINLDMLEVLNCIQKKCSRALIIRIFTGIHESYLSYHCLRQDIHEILGFDGVEVLHSMDSTEYMRELSKGDICLESYPFGSSNVMTEYLHLGKPVVAYQGDEFFNRIGSAILQRLGLDELITRDPQQYISLTVRLLEDDSYRQEIREKIIRFDANEIAQQDYSDCFAAAFRYLLAHQEEFTTDQAQKIVEVSPEKQIQVSLASSMAL